MRNPMIDDARIQKYLRNPTIRNWLEVLAAIVVMRIFILFGGVVYLIPPIAHWIDGHPGRMTAVMIPLTLPMILLTISIASGWWGLSLTYRTERPLPENRRTGSAGFRYFAGYNNVLRLGSDREGLYLSVWVRLFHPPLFIPWSDVEIGSEKSILFRKGRTLKLGLANRVPFSIDKKTADRLLLGRDGPKIEAPGSLTYGAQERGFVRRLFP